MTRIKICGITRIEDALACADAGVDAIGLVFFEKSARYVEVEKARAIVERLPAFVSVVGLFVNAAEHVIQTTLEQVPLDLLQFHGEEAPEFCRSFARPFIRAIRVRSAQDWAQAELVYSAGRGILADAYVEGVQGGTGKQFDWTLLPEHRKLPLILAGGLTTANVAGAIQKTRPWAVDVSGGVELDANDGGTQKGLKDAAKIHQFVHAVRSAT